MTGKLRLEDLRRVVDCGNDDCSCNEIALPVTVADWVEVGRQLGAERLLVSSDPESQMVSFPPGSYLLFRLPVESPTPKEGEQ